MTNFVRIIHEAKHGQSGKQIINIYHYEDPLDEVWDLNNLDQVAQAFNVIVPPAVLGIVSSAYVEVATKVFSYLTGIEAINTDRAGNIGARGGAGLVDHTAASFILRRSSSDVRSGGKRFSPLFQGDFDEVGALSPASIQGQIASLEVALATGVLDPFSLTTMPPVIARVVFNPQAVSAASVVSVAQFRRANTQSSRKA